MSPLFPLSSCAWAKLERAEGLKTITHSAGREISKPPISHSAGRESPEKVLKLGKGMTGSCKPGIPAPRNSNMQVCVVQFRPMVHSELSQKASEIINATCRISPRPDTFLRYTYPDLLEKSRSAVAPLLGVSMDEVVFVPNATTGVNTVLPNLVYQKGDVIVHFSTVYGACEKTIDSLCETEHIERVCVHIDYPEEDEDIISKFINTVEDLKNDGKTVKLAMFDTVLTFPGARFPWEAMVETCKTQQILSLIDGAHGVGHVDLTHLGRVSPDFFTSNCYKYVFPWLWYILSLTLFLDGFFVKELTKTKSAVH
jgi:hypothetical protein